VDRKAIGPQRAVGQLLFDPLAQQTILHDRIVTPGDAAGDPSVFDRWRIRSTINRRRQARSAGRPRRRLETLGPPPKDEIASDPADAI